MDAAWLTRERVIAAALHVAAGRQSRETREPGAYDDAQAELESDMLNDVLAEYVAAVSQP